MPTPYTTKQGQTVDIVCAEFYGRTAEVTEAVLAANPGLASLGPVLPLGTVISLPEIKKKTSASQLVGLWD